MALERKWQLVARFYDMPSCSCATRGGLGHRTLHDATTEDLHDERCEGDDARAETFREGAFERFAVHRGILPPSGQIDAAELRPCHQHQRLSIGRR